MGHEFSDHGAWAPLGTGMKAGSEMAREVSQVFTPETIVLYGRLPSVTARARKFMFDHGYKVIECQHLETVSKRMAEKPKARLVVILEDVIPAMAEVIERRISADNILRDWTKRAEMELKLLRRYRRNCIAVDSASSLNGLAGAFDLPGEGGEKGDRLSVPEALAALTLESNTKALCLRGALSTMIHPPGWESVNFARLQEVFLEELRSRDQERKRLEEERKHFSAEADRHFKEVERLTRQVVYQDEERKHFSAEADRHVKEVERLTRQAVYQDEEISRFFNSWSWKVTAPLRAARRITGL